MTPPQSNALPLFALGVALLALCARLTPSDSPQPPSVALVVPETPPPSPLNHERLYRALIEVESGGDPHAVGDGGRAVGVLQIHPIMVRDVNRILGYDRWTLEDRWSASESRVMLEVYLRHYGAASYEEAARKWNGGPDGHEQRQTLKYWESVRALLQAQ